MPRDVSAVRSGLARSESARLVQFASSRCEQWLGLHCVLLARRHFPDDQLDGALARRFHEFYRAMWNEETGRPVEEASGRHTYRVLTNSAPLISVLCDAYQAGQGIVWLKRAAKLADCLEERQVDEGFYAVPDVMDPNVSVVYTSVLYSAQSVLRLCEIERERDNLNTEGQDSFEDGMIACSAAQLALYALSLDDLAERKRSTEAAEFTLTAQSCLEQKLIPDARMSCGSLRLWEAQYDVLARKSWNMMNSPHGWTAWSLCAAHYLYLLTGKTMWLTHLFNSMGACAQLMDPESGTRRSSFIRHPYVEVSLLEPDPTRPGRGRLCETVLRTASVYETDNGIFAGRNCQVDSTATTIIVTATDPVIDRLHVNTRSSVDIDASLGDTITSIRDWHGYGWAPISGAENPG